MDRDRLIKLLKIAIGIFCAWLIVRYVLSWVAPFILALITAWALEPGVRSLMRRLRLKRGIASTIYSVLVLAVVSTLSVLLFTTIADYVQDFLSNLPELISNGSSLIDSIRSKITSHFSSTDGKTKAVTNSLFACVSNMMGRLPEKVSSWAIDCASCFASEMPKYLMFAVTYIISVFFISASYPQVIEFIMKQVPKKWHSKTDSLKEDFLSAIVKWLKAILIMMGCTFVQLFVSFLILRIPYSLLMAALISSVDALPVLGTGTILIPWAIINLIDGEYKLSIGIAVTYVVVNIVHSVIEPKIMGKQFGLSPVATLIALYVGFCTIGVIGMIVFPFVLMILKQLNDKDYIKLWK